MRLERDQPAADALAALGVGIVEADSGYAVVAMNSFASKMTGWSLEDARGQSIDVVFRLCENQTGVRLDWLQRFGVQHIGLPEREEATLIRRDGQRFPVEFSVTSTKRDRAKRGGCIFVFTDVTEKLLMAHQMARFTNLDLLTGLLNRKAFTEHLTSALEACNETNEEHIVCFIDIDQFKLVNDTCGHEAGDDLIQWVAALLRECAGERDSVARFGGDEFVVLLTRSTIDEARIFVDRVQRRMLEFSFTWGDKSFQITAAAGLAAVTSGQLTSSHILSAADHACYMAKDKGRGGIRVYDHRDKEASGRFDEMNLVARIHRRLRDGSVILHAQRIASLVPGDKRGLHFEVLLRFRESDGSLSDPGRTIGATERYGLMPAVDRWVIHNVFTQLAAVGPKILGSIHICFVNLSGLSLQDDSMLDFIRSELSESGVPPHKIGFEITETAAVQNLQQAQWFIQELGSIGCSLSLDDFGTGAASYSYLKSLPVQYLKIDGGFVESMANSPLDLAMVESINQIAHVLGIETVAESVATDELLRRVSEIGIDHAQGYHLALPEPMDEFCRKLASS